MRRRLMPRASPGSGGGAGTPQEREALRTSRRAAAVRMTGRGAGARSVEERASASTSARGANARSARGRASARTSANENQGVRRVKLEDSGLTLQGVQTRQRRMYTFSNDIQNSVLVAHWQLTARGY